MSLWNPKTAFSRPAAAGPASDYDSTLPADPVRSTPDRPAVGFGEAYVGRTSTTVDAPRNPIGFAPSQETEPRPPARYRTELSFRRHVEAPRASAVSDPSAEDAPTSWRTPSFALPAAEPAPAPISFEDVAADEGSVPFYRREISFRRKKSVNEATAEPAAGTPSALDVDSIHEGAPVDELEEPSAVEADEPEVVAVELAAEVVDDEELDVHEIEIHDGVAPEVEVHVDALSADTLDIDEPEALLSAEADSVAEEKVPFYKRELGFRRRKHAEQDTVTAPVEESHTDEPELEVPVPSDPIAEPEPEHAPVELLPAAVLPVVEDEPVVEEPVAVEASWPEPVAELVAEADEPVVEEPAAVEDSRPELLEELLADADEPSHDDAEPTADEPASTQELPETEQELAVTASSEMPADALPSNGSRKSRPPKEKRAKSQRNQSGRNRKVVGLKIGASQLAAAVVQRTESGYELLELARRPLAEGIVVDGDVRDELALANALKSFFEDENLPKNDVRVGLSSNRIGVRTFEMDGIEDPERFDNAVRFKAHEVLPVALNESMLDYRVVTSRIDENGKEIRKVLLVVAPRDQVEPYQRVAERAGIRLIGADLEALALLRAFVPPPKPDRPVEFDTATVAVAIGHESSTLLVAGAGACEFTRVFDWGGSALEDSIAAALDVRPVEAAMMLRHLSLSGPGRQYDALDDVTRAEATEAVRQRLTPFAREFVNSLQFYQTQTDSLGIGGILITGGTSHLEGLDAALHQMIGVEVSVGDPFARVVRAREFDPAIEATIGSMAVSIGLAIDEDSARGVNLLPGVVKGSREGKATLVKVALPIAAVIPFAALGFLYAGAHSQANDRQAEIDAVKAQIAALPQPVKPVLETGVVGDEAARATAVANLLGGRVPWDGVFRDLAKVLPGNVWLTNMSLTQPGADSLSTSAAATQPLPGQGEATPTAVSIEGYTYAQPDVALLLARLATLPTLQRVTLSSSAAEVLGTKDVIHFVIVADLNQPGGAS